jgi:AAA15 family ATPase/GTPase
MIIRFRFKNYRSFKDEQELSLVAGNGTENPESIIATNVAPHGLLRCAAIYGANASGKSNVLRALQFFVNAVRNSQRNWAPEGKIDATPFSLSKSAETVSVFRLDFVVKDIPYEYGFSINSERIVGEWLNSFPKGRRQVWFERTEESSEIKFGESLVGENRSIEKLTRKNSLFLSAAAQNNHAMLSPLFSWLTSKLTILFDSHSSFNSEAIGKYSDSSRLGKFLARADLGIVGLKVHTQPNDEKSIAVMEAIVEKIKEFYPPPPDSDFRAPKEITKIFLEHQSEDGSAVEFENALESAGTMAFLSLLAPALEALDTGGVLCVDELNSSLHPLLALELVRLFNNSEINKSGAQFIFNTHDVNLLDAEVLRRDQVWFTEKAAAGDSHLYALADFKPRVNENLKRGYLQGRYGAIPYLSSLNFKNFAGPESE